MSEPDSSTEAPAIPPAHRRARWQFGLRSLVLLTAAVAVWLTYALERRRIADLSTRIASLRALAHDLVVDDPGKIAVVKREELWYDENRWDIHLPAGCRYRLCLATRGIADQGFPTPAASAPISPGRHIVAVDQVRDGDGWRITAACDGKSVLTIAEPKEWDPGTGASISSDYQVSQQIDPGESVVLFRRRFKGPRNPQGSSTLPQGPTSGVMLWIEPYVPTAAGPAPAGR